MTTSRRLVVVVLLALFLAGCIGKKIRLDPRDPLFSYKNAFYSRYQPWVLKEEYTALVLSKTKEEVDRLINVFWSIRDTDPTTKENEYKAEIDARISYVESDGLMKEMPAIMNFNFKNNGGTRGEMGKIYLLLGKPNYIERLPEGRLHSELMVWYYIDDDMKPRYAFLFYRRYGNVRLFENQTEDWRRLVDPYFSPLKEISINHLVGDPEEVAQKLADMLAEIAMSSERWQIFIDPVMRLSYYDDINKSGIGGVFVPPTPASVLAEKYKPIAFGQPRIKPGSELISSVFNATLPIEFLAQTLIIKGNPTASFLINFRYNNFDWVSQPDGTFGSSLQCIFGVKSLDTKKNIGAENFELKLEGFPKEIVTGPAGISVRLSKFEEYFDKLPSGKYSVSFYIMDNATKKYTSGSVVISK